MNIQPLVSVLMTSYNRENYIAEAIESVLASTYKNFELIIVDDRSKDRTVEIARSYESKDDRVKVYINEKNLGDYPNRNKAASYAKGFYIMPRNAANNTMKKITFFVIIIVYWLYASTGAGLRGFTLFFSRSKNSHFYARL